MLTIKRFKALADSYGGRLERWPAGVRGEAEMLLNGSPQARQILSEASALDEAMEAARRHDDEIRWAPEQSDAALARLRAGVSTRLAMPSARAKLKNRITWMSADRMSWLFSPKLGTVAMAMGCGCTVLAGLFIGFMDAPAQSNFVTMLQPDVLQVLVE